MWLGDSKIRAQDVDVRRYSVFILLSPLKIFNRNTKQNIILYTITPWARAARFFLVSLITIFDILSFWSTQNAFQDHLYSPGYLEKAHRIKKTISLEKIYQFRASEKFLYPQIKKNCVSRPTKKKHWPWENIFEWNFSRKSWKIPFENIFSRYTMIFCRLLIFCVLSARNRSYVIRRCQKKNLDGKYYFFVEKSWFQIFKNHENPLKIQHVAVW